MSKQIYSQENLFRKICKYKYIHFIIVFLLLFFSKNILGKERWALDKELSTIEFELPVFLGRNVNGSFIDMEGLVEIDLVDKKNNKGIFSVKIESIDTNYTRFKELLLSETFFSSNKFPIAFIDTKKFSYDNQKTLKILVELNIKGISKNLPIELDIIQLSNNLVQIKGNLKFLRKDFDIGTGNWSSTAILKNKVTIKVNLFLFKN